MLADFQASMPFLILALSVLAFFGNSLPLLISSWGFLRLGALCPHRAQPRHRGERAGYAASSGNSAQARHESIFATSCRTLPRR